MRNGFIQLSSSSAAQSGSATKFHLYVELDLHIYNSLGTTLIPSNLLWYTLLCFELLTWQSSSFTSLFFASNFLLRLLVTMPACFNKLPFEVKTMVWSYIDYDYPSDPFQRESVSLVPYACVSREWQLAFERLTFRKVVVRSSQVRRFNEYVIAHRMASLRTLRFRIIIPKFHPNDPVERRRWDNRAFTKSIKDLWALLKSIEDGCANRQALKLRVHLSAQPSDPLCPFRNGLLDFADDRNSDDFRVREVDEPDEFAKMSNWLQFKSMRIPQDLPVIPWVDELIWSGPGFLGVFREVHGVALMKLASRFNDLTYFKASLGDELHRSTQVRSDLAREMSHLSLPRLSEFVFEFDVLPHHEFNRLPNISSRSSDAFSMAVHRLLQSPNLLKVTLGDPNLNSRVRFTPELFWPQLKEFGGGQKPFWPCLQSIIVMISSVSPDGTRLHIHEHLVGEFESVRLNMNKVNPLFMAAARAAQYMPKLLEMKLGVEAHKDMDNPLCEMAFAAQGYCSEEDIKGDHAALRLDGFIFPGSRKLVLRSYQLDLSKPRVSVVMPSKCTIDSRLAQVWKTSKGENVDYNVCSGFVLDDDDDEDNDYYDDENDEEDD